VCAVLRAVAADSFFNCWCLEIPSDNRILHVPKCMHCHAQVFRSEAYSCMLVIINFIRNDLEEDAERLDGRSSEI
jgi:hypothetical protein